MAKYKHFTTKELACPCCGKVYMDKRFMSKIVALREELEKAMNVTSGFRCKKHNKNIGGATKSAHMDALALDIRIKSDSYTRELITLAIECGFSGIEVGSKHIHIDDKTRNKPVLWAGVSR